LPVRASRVEVQMVETTELQTSRWKFVFLLSAMHLSINKATGVDVAPDSGWRSGSPQRLQPCFPRRLQRLRSNCRGVWFFRGLFERSMEDD